MIGAYFGDLERRLGSFPLAVAVEAHTEQVDLDRGYVKAVVTFTDGSQLHVFEHVVMEEAIPTRETYRYHYQTAEGDLVKRWDNGPHHRQLPTFPHHVHVGDEVRPSEPVDLDEVLAEISGRLRSS